MNAKNIDLSSYAMLKCFIYYICVIYIVYYVRKRQRKAYNMVNIIKNDQLYYAYLSGARKVMENKQHLNKINVFPVPDGDTGSNLSSTMSSIINESKISESIKHTIESIANASLSGARGNSGIIFAQYLNGVSVGMRNEPFLTLSNFSDANLMGVEYAYNAIETPVEGTMITVIKAWANALKEFQHKAGDFIELLTCSYEKLEQALELTTQQLNVLKKASVVDSGAKGFLFFIKGFIEAITDDKKHIELPSSDESMDNMSMSQDQKHEFIDAKYRYCTEAMIEGEHISHQNIKKQLRSLGDSLIVAGNEKRTRIHIHTNQPHRVFEIVGEQASITYQKVDDMQRQKDIVQNRKYDIALVTDSIADLPQSMVDDYQIHVINLNILLEDANYLDKLTITNQRILNYVKQAATVPTSSQPDFKRIENLFNYLMTYYESIIVVTVSKALSGTYNIINQVAKTFNKEKEVISVINSKQNSGAEGLIVKQCAEAIHKGKNYEAVVEQVYQIIEQSKILVSVKTLDNMIKSGRLSTRAGKIAKALNLKPLVTLDSNGKGALEGVAFSDKGSLRRLKQSIKKVIKKQAIQSYSIVHVNNELQAKDYAKIFTRIIGKAPDYITEASSIIAVGAGEGAVAFSYITKEKEK